MRQSRMCSFWRGYRRLLPHSLYVATVVACAVYLLHGLRLPLELPATALLAGVAQIYSPAPAAEPDVRRHLAVVAIDDERFRRDYRGASPLDRCTLRDDLERLLANPKIRMLAIDLDLSPADPAAYQAYFSQQSQPGQCLATGELSIVERPQRCQCELEHFLQHKSQQVHIIAISPLAPTEGRFAGRRWDDAQVFPHIQFGQPRLDLRFGMVYDYQFWPPDDAGRGRAPLAELVSLQLCDAPAKGGAGFAWPAPAGCETIRAQRASTEPLPISYFETRHLHNNGFPLGLADPCLAGQAPERESRQRSCDIRLVLLGGSYGVVDQYLTPLGERNGLEIHAAIAAQLRSHTWHGVGLLADVLLGGLVFGPLAQWMWTRYFRQRCAPAPARGGLRHPRMAYGWFVALAVVFTGLLAIAALLSTWAYAYWGWWISPVPVGLGMLIEAAVGSGVHAATHTLEHEIEHAQSTITELERRVSELQSTLSGTPLADAPAATASSATAAPWAARLPTALAWLLIATAAFKLLRELFHF